MYVPKTIEGKVYSFSFSFIEAGNVNIYILHLLLFSPPPLNTGKDPSHVCQSFLIDSTAPLLPARDTPMPGLLQPLVGKF